VIDVRVVRPHHRSVDPAGRLAAKGHLNGETRALVKLGSTAGRIHGRVTAHASRLMMDA